MKAKPLKLIYGVGYEPCSVEEATHVELNMPGPLPYRCLPIQLRGTREGTGNWSWNGDVDKPTLKPSIKTTGWVGANTCNDDGKPSRKVICHTWVNDGKAQFLDDCTHELVNQTVELLEVEDAT